MPGDPAPLQELVSQLLLPQPGGYMTGSLDLPPVTEIGLDAAYVLCAGDIAVSRLSMAEVVRGGTPPSVRNAKELFRNGALCYLTTKAGLRSVLCE